MVEGQAEISFTNEGEVNFNNEGRIHIKEGEEVTFSFLIMDPISLTYMNIIPPLALSHFHGKVLEDPDAFVFKIYILYHTS